MKKKLLAVLTALTLAVGMIGCGGSDGFNADEEISIITREDGSGTRGAFIELFGIEKKNEEGNKIDYTTDAASITNSTSVMMTTVESDLHAIGYISLGSLNDTVKAVKIDGVEASVANIKNGSYSIYRPFNIAVKEGLSDVAQDFINYILSAEGQAVIEGAGYITVSENGAFASNGASGKITVAGSSSVSPVMQKLKEAYVAVNAKAEIEILTSDSSTGMSNAIEGICDIGMASRAVKDSEKEKGLTEITIANDGVAVIVNKENPVESMTKSQVEQIYTGAVTNWSDIVE
ncbi:MAG: substrate-binding domain-containing protein [Lachnospiraceae bacterium]|nr:substrate-binding domain-containing protein [Lachnospiraceae bacterium]